MKYAEPYDTRRSPPAPVMRVKITNPVTGQSLTQHHYVDTGFDATLLVDQQTYNKLQLHLTRIDEEAYALHAGTLAQPLTVAAAHVEIANIYASLEKIYVHPLPVKPLIGRQILNKLYIHLKGPQNTLQATTKNTNNQEQRRNPAPA